MKKSDLKTGMILEHRSGQTSVVFLDNVYGKDAIVFSDSSWTDINDFDDSFNWTFLSRGLPREHGVDVMKIYKPDLPTGFLTRESKFGSMQVLWERKEEKPIVTLDGVDYSESTLRSLIKKATN